MSPIPRLAIVTLALLALPACAHTGLKHSDAVSYGYGDAVKSNLAIHTVNPSKASMYKTGGLGKNGSVIAVDTETE